MKAKHHSLNLWLLSAFALFSANAQTFQPAIGSQYASADLDGTKHIDCAGRPVCR